MNSDNRSKTQLFSGTNQARDNWERDGNIFLITGTLFCLVMLPVAIYRTVTANWALALVDWLIMLLCTIILTYGFFSRNVRAASFIFIGFLICMNVTSAIQINSNLIYYAFPLVMMGFYLLPVPFALISCGIPTLATITYFFIQQTPTFGSLSVFTILLFGVGIASGLARHQLDRITMMANQDPLTGVGNRRAMSRKLDYVMEQRDLTKTSFSMLIVDFDHFKKINDTYGHHIGDSILTQAMTLLAERVRVSDSIFRFGGEEFVLILERTDEDDAEKLAEELRQLIESSKLIADYKVTVSIGVAELFDKESINDWIKRGDQALFQAKQSGRNKTILSSKPENDSPHPSPTT